MNIPAGNYTNGGSLSKSNSQTITINYTYTSNNNLSASLDFELTDGKVDWEIMNPKKETVFKGYVIYENGKVYRELTYPSNYSSGYLNKRGEETINIPDFNCLQSGKVSMSGEYTVYLKPQNAEGSYKVLWSDMLPEK